METQTELEAFTARLIACRRCERLTEWREEVARVRRKAYRQETYWGRPVPGFGDPQARVVVVGLAPGAHGANRTGRSFTGDGAGEFLYRALYRAGFANQPTALHRNDGLSLHDLYIAAVCRCVPPDNKPHPQELANCLPFLEEELGLLKNKRILVALGKIALEGVTRLAVRQGGKLPNGARFQHGGRIDFGAGFPLVITSYHPSRQNTQTGRLTEAMFDAIWEQVRQELTAQ